jgi:hypothetical protein
MVANIADFDLDLGRANFTISGSGRVLRITPHGKKRACIISISIFSKLPAHAGYRFILLPGEQNVST